MPTQDRVRTLQDELKRQEIVIDEIFVKADKDGRDPSPAEKEIYENAVSRMEALQPEIDFHTRALEVTTASAARAAQLDQAMARRAVIATPSGLPEYRSVGHYLHDQVAAMRGDRQAGDRIEIYNRTAAHNTTTNLAGIVPQPIVGPVINFIDASRPLVSALGPRPLEGGPQFFRPRVTTHTSVAKQSAQKSEFSSTALVIDQLTATVDTYGGYVNVARQVIDWSMPSAWDMIVGDLADVYAQTTEAAACTAFAAAATAGTTIPTGATTAAAIAAAVWDAVATIYGTVKGGGRVIAVASPTMLGVVGPAFTPVNPQNAQSTGFNASDFGSGLMGSIGGVPVYVSPQLSGSVMLVMSTMAAEVYDQRVGLLQVTEPSVGGVQVAYMGYFSPLVIAAGGIVKITKTP